MNKCVRIDANHTLDIEFGPLKKRIYLWLMQDHTYVLDRAIVTVNKSKRKIKFIKA